ncbi:MAG: precorrin-6y C5,15-methyltransferase (decarboxylating) subunit CbiE [Ilumatobacteraceae bacterium]
MADRPITVIGVIGGEAFGDAARAAIRDADVLVGSSRHLSRFTDSSGDHVALVELAGPLPPILDVAAEHRAAGRRVCVLSSGDPGFFGITRVLSERFGAARLRVLPAPSSVSLAWAAIGASWDDADVVSAHGRPLAEAVDRARRSPKVAVLTAPANPPETLGKELLTGGCGPRQVVVVSRLGEHDEQIVRTDLDGLAAGQFDPMSVVLLTTPTSGVTGPSLSWGRAATHFAHRAGMITKSEVRSIVLGKLELPRSGVLWDVGAGSGAVGIEAATIAPGLRVHAVERSGDDARNIDANAAAAGVSTSIEVVVGAAPAALDRLPCPDRVFVGGGGLDVLEACWDRLGPGGILVATFVVLDRAVAAMELLGAMIQVHVDHAVPIGGVGMRLEPTNPTFVCWGHR